jgi:hypothetical protein
MKKIFFAFVSFGYIIFTSSTCKKNGNCTETSYSFEAPAKVINPYDSIMVGDTIWLEINAPITQKELLSGQITSFSNALNLGTAIGFGELINPNSPVYAANEFNYVLIKGTNVANPNTLGIREYRFLESTSAYEFRLGIIPKRKGVFNFGLSNAANVYRKSDKCTKAFYRIYFKETPLHLYYLRQIFGTNIDSSYSSPYCFKVK